MNHNTRANHYAGLERRYRTQIIGGLRDAGLTYTQIRELLGVSLRQIETVLGEAQALRANGFRAKEIAAELGVPTGSLGRILPSPRGSPPRSSAAPRCWSSPPASPRYRDARTCTTAGSWAWWVATTAGGRWKSS